MLKFFRRIRLDLMKKNKTGKPALPAGRYFKYAVGEIVLVVIGILIALQINNWNEDQKAKHKEKINLRNLKSEMKASLLELNSDYKSHLKSLEATLDVHHYIQTKPKLIDSMYIDFFDCIRIDYFFPKRSTYETLKSGNLEVIRSDSLRALITDVYEAGYERISMKVDTRRNAGRLLFPYYQKHFNSKMEFERDSVSLGSTFNNIGIPVNYEFIINDPEFETLIVEAIHGRLNVKRDYERTIGWVENCISQIDKYLKD